MVAAAASPDQPSVVTEPWSSAGAPQDARRAEVESRLAWVRSVLLAAPGRYGLLVTSRASFAWLTLGGLNHVVVGSEGGAVPLLVTRDAAFALAPVNEAARIADEELAGLPIEVVAVPWEDPGALAAEASRLAGGLPLPEVEVAHDLEARRSGLGEIEHGRLRAVAAELASVLDGVLPTVVGGEAEDAIAGRVAGALLERGIRAPVLLVAADERIARYRHPLPTRQPVRERAMVVVVAERWGLHVATTRFVDLVRRSADLERRAEATARVLAAMRDATRVGVSLGDVLTAAREAYRATGFEAEWRLHHQGGTIGYAPRERIATPGDATRLEAGMAVAWNPSITGTKLEQTLLVAPGDAEPLPG